MPKYHPDTPQTPHHTPLHIPDTNIHQQTPTDITRHSQTLQDITREVAGSVWGCLVLSWGVLCCLGVDRKMLRAVWDAFMGVSGTWVSLGCYPRAQPLRDRAWINQL